MWLLLLLWVLIYSTAKTFIASSPKSLIAFTAILPGFGPSNARDLSLFTVAHALPVYLS